MNELAMQSSADIVQIMDKYLSDPGVEVQKLEQLISLHERLLDRQQKQEFRHDFGSAQAEFPTIERTTAGHFGPFAPYHVIVATVKPILRQFNLSFDFSTEPLDNGEVRVTCHLHHDNGYSHCGASLIGPRDTSGGKNSIQGTGSATTYLCRYTLMPTLGLAIGGDDDGGMPLKAVTVETISDEQLIHLTEAIESKEKPETWKHRILKRYMIDRLGDLPVSKYGEVIEKL